MGKNSISVSPSVRRGSGGQAGRQVVRTYMYIRVRILTCAVSTLMHSLVHSQMHSLCVHKVYKTRFVKIYTIHINSHEIPVPLSFDVYVVKWLINYTYTKMTPSYWYRNPIINLRRSTDLLGFIMGIPIFTRKTATFK